MEGVQILNVIIQLKSAQFSWTFISFDPLSSAVRLMFSEELLMVTGPGERGGSEDDAVSGGLHS